MGKPMNENKIAFIITTNNPLYYEECVTYVKELNVPEGYCTDILRITQANSMAEAYNAAMEESDAKYKVYLHQDVYIRNKNFIGDLLAVFKADKEIGLVGVIGGVILPKNAVIWNSWNIGCAYACNHKSMYPIKLYQEQNSPYLMVEAVDGMLMATQYDIIWREDLDLRWDFYDISQSLEFRKKGYDVVIPYQEEPWCLHDCGYSNLFNYDSSREKMLKEYFSFFTEPFDRKYNTELWELNQKLCNVLEELLNKGDFCTALEVIKKFPYSSVENNTLIYTYNLIVLYFNEKYSGIMVNGFFHDTPTWEQMLDKYIQIKFLLRRLETDFFEEDAQKEIVHTLLSCGITKTAVNEIISHNIYNEKRVKKTLIKYGFDI